MWYWCEYPLPRGGRPIYRVGMMVCEDRGLALITESELKISKTQRSFWKRPAQIPLSAWPAWRDKHLGRLLDKFEYFPIWQAPDGEHKIRVATVRKTGDELTIVLPAREERWIKGEPPPKCIHNIGDLAWLWDQRVNFERRETFMRHLEYCEYKEESLLYDMAYHGRWHDLLKLLERQGAHKSAQDYLRKLLS